MYGFFVFLPTFCVFLPGQIYDKRIVCVLQKPSGNLPCVFFTSARRFRVGSYLLYYLPSRHVQNLWTVIVTKKCQLIILSLLRLIWGSFYSLYVHGVELNDVAFLRVHSYMRYNRH